MENQNRHNLAYYNSATETWTTVCSYLATVNWWQPIRVQYNINSDFVYIHAANHLVLVRANSYVNAFI